MKAVLSIFLLSLFASSAMAECTLTREAAAIYRTLSVRACGANGTLCVFAAKRGGPRWKELLRDERCDPYSFATCTYRADSFSVRMFLPCTVRPVENCAAIYNIYARGTNENLASCQN